MYNYYINGDYRYIYTSETDSHARYSVANHKSGYFLDRYNGKPDDKYLVKAGIEDYHSMFVLHYDGIRTNHDDYWWDYEVGTYLSSPNDERFKWNTIDGVEYVEFMPFKPRYRIYKYRGDFYIWCCDEHVIRRIIKDEGLEIEYDEFPAEHKYFNALETDWEFIAEFNTWYACFYYHTVRFKTSQEIHNGN